MRSPSANIGADDATTDALQNNLALVGVEL